MKKEYKKISIMVYLNIFIIIILETLHSELMNVSDELIFVVLFIYALINGWYIQKELRKKEKAETNMLKEKQLSSKILQLITSGVTIIAKDAHVEYMNKTMLDILELSDEKKYSLEELSQLMGLNLELLMRNAIEGRNEEKVSHQFVNNNSNKAKYITIEIEPFRYYEEDMKYDIMIVIEDITETIELQEKIKLQYLDMIKSFVKIIDAKDVYTGQHSQNVSKYVQLITSKLVTSDKNIDCEAIKIAASLHDIGKVGVPEYILNKAGKLTKQEYETMKGHSQIGYELISGISGYGAIANMIKNHHERWDGYGYPDGLSGDEIPMGSQIIAVADAFDAITTKRIYRDERTIAEAIEILKEESGKQFSPTIAAIFIDEIIKLEEVGYFHK